MERRQWEEFSALKGAVIRDISGLVVGSDAVRFVLEDGRQFEMWHEQDCCESVSVDDITGDIADLIGHEVLMAEEVDSPEDLPDSDDESYTWTFYKLATIKGYVTIRWYGSSNGYYSESVSFALVRAQDARA